jgi:spore photoproduct lyase
MASEKTARKPITSFVDAQVARGVWREQEIPPEISGLARSICVFRAKRSSSFITHDWHGDKETFCPPMWWDLGIGSGACGLGCRSCFLMLTHRALRDPLRHVLYENEEDFAQATETWLLDSTRRHQHTLGVGIDRSDSLLYEGVTGHVRRLAPLFAHPETNRQRCKLVLLTKSTNTHYLAHVTPDQRQFIVVSLSLNPDAVADAWEGKWSDGVRITPSITHRLEAAKLAQDLGFEVRVRLDPILPIEGWQEQYAAFIADTKTMGIHFHYWTLGTYREKNTQLDGWRERWGLPAMEWQPQSGELVKEGTHRHLPENRRIGIYTTVRDLIQREYPQGRVSLCKETHSVRRALRLCNADCNCLI